MANYALTVTPKFTPFTYDELIKPIETYQKVYDTYDATYEKAAEEAAKFASLDAEKDPIAYQRYQNYLQNIQKQRDALYKSGLSNSTRRGFQDLRSTYSTEIKPMEIAYDKKLEDIKNYDKLMMTNPQMRAVRNPHETSLDEYMTNDELGNRYIDLNMVEKSAADIFSKAREKVIQYGHLDPETRDIITRVGLTPGEILAALEDAAEGGNTNAAKTINRIREEVRNQFGYYEIDNDSVKNDIDATITRAAWNLRGDETHQYVTDASAKRALDNAEWYAKEDYKHALELDKIAKQAEAKARAEKEAAENSMPRSFLLAEHGDDTSTTYVDSRGRKYSVKDLVIKPVYMKNQWGQTTTTPTGRFSYTTEGYQKAYKDIADTGGTGRGHPLNSRRKEELDASIQEYREYINKLVAIARAQDSNFDKLSPEEQKQKLLQIESNNLVTKDRTALTGDDVVETGQTLFKNYVTEGTELSYTEKGSSKEKRGTFSPDDINRVVVNPDSGIYAIDKSGNRINLNSTFSNIVNPVKAITKALDFQGISEYNKHKEAPSFENDEGWEPLKGTHGVKIYVQNQQKTDNSSGGLRVYIKTPYGAVYASNANNPLVGQASIEMLSQEMSKLMIQGETNFKGTTGLKLSELFK